MVIILAIQVGILPDYRGGISEHCNADSPLAVAQRDVWGTVIGCCRINEVSFSLEFCELCVRTSEWNCEMSFCS